MSQPTPFRDAQITAHFARLSLNDRRKWNRLSQRSAHFTSGDQLFRHIALGFDLPAFEKACRLLDLQLASPFATTDQPNDAA